jgi:hypothetical protein
MRRFTLMSLLFLIAYIVPASAQSRNVLFPRFVTGGGWTSEFFFTNQGLASVSIEVKFYDASGAAATVDSNLGTASNYTFSLAGGATQAIQLNPGATALEGYVVATYPSSTAPIRGSEVFRCEQNGVVLVEVGVPQQEFGQHFSFPVEVNSEKHINTAVGITKPAYVNSYDEYLVATLIKPDGKIQAIRQVPMHAGQHIGRYITEDWLFPWLDRENFTGSISISSPFGVGVVVLRQDREAFGGVSADSGPILSPFALTGPVVQEVATNNDDKANAQSLSGSSVIEGSISPSGDLDTYKFAAQKGDIITIIGDTTQKNSNLDPMIVLFDANLTAISANDQNGLTTKSKNSGDSFIQCVIPKDGTYYIMIVDYHGGAGDYVLHINLLHAEG